MKPTGTNRFVRLLIASAAVTIIWCGVLPWLSERPSQKSYLDRLSAQGIDASAMTYTELPSRLLLDHP